MEIYMLEYYKETDDGDTITEEYNLIGLYLSKKEAQNAKRKFALERKIDKNLLFVSMSEIGRVQWEGGFVSSDEIYQNTVTLTACFNEWLGIDKALRNHGKTVNITMHFAMLNKRYTTSKIYRILRSTSGRFGAGGFLTREKVLRISRG